MSDYNAAILQIPGKWIYHQASDADGRLMFAYIGTRVTKIYVCKLITIVDLPHKQFHLRLARMKSTITNGKLNPN